SISVQDSQLGRGGTS
nr:immunoglobulin heavy chain junction region [Mus musculus]